MERAWLSDFVLGLGCAQRAGGYAVLRDPQWSEREKAACDVLFEAAETLPTPADGWLCLRTGGSTGGVAFARHDEHTVAAAVTGFCTHFGLDRVNAVSVLPPWHVSGFMSRLRCAATGGEHVVWDWKQLEAGEAPVLDARRRWLLSLVPTQLQRLLVRGHAVDWLRRFDIVFVGGGPVWPALADSAAAAGLRVSLSYGMTETAAMIAAQLPDEFLAGDRTAGRPMPHVRLGIADAGRLTVSGPSLFRGYFPGTRVEETFVTGDFGEITTDGRVRIFGRADAVIITGGKKVNALEVEGVLRDSGEFPDVVVLGVPDAEWGEAVIACYPGHSSPPDVQRASASLADYQRPKRFVAVSPWPRTAQGKVNRAALAAWVAGR